MTLKQYRNYPKYVGLNWSVIMFTITIQDLYSRLKLEVAEFIRWRRAPHVSDELRVFYGLNNIPGPEEILTGGLVKLQDLVREFPNRPEKPHLLYLVSSGLPAHVTRMSTIARKNGCKIVVNQNGVAYPAWCPDDYDMVNRTMSRLLGQAHHVFYQSDFCRMAADEFVGRCAGSSEILYNPVDTSFFVPPEDKTPNKEIRLLLAGSHGSPYRVEVAIQTLSLLRQRSLNCRLIIAGRFAWDSREDHALAQAREMAKKENVLNFVDFQGVYSQSEAVTLFQAANILIHTKYNDPCPRLVVEAMACGLPVLYSASGGVPELVGDAAGVGVAAPLDWTREHPPSPDALAHAAEVILANLETYAVAARERALGKFDVVPWLRRHREVFSSLVLSQSCIEIV